MQNFSGMTVLVTGGSGILGQAVVREFFQRGAEVASADHATGRMAPAFQDLADARRTLWMEGVDLTDPQAAHTMVQQALDRFGKIDILVNTVGGYQAGKPVHETPVETWDFMLDLNARSAFLVSRAVLPAMLAQGQGKVVHVAAAAALKGSANSSAYAASKSALARLTESMAEEYKRQGINVNAVLPSVIDTPQNRQAMPKADFSQWVTPEAMARVIAFLASEEASPIHGALIPVYGRK
jgi:NAD(P)-dependent dehydrogenase (short-subunit alcohol dehydrogenase family)